MADLDGKVALVTGASKGIGLAVSEAFARAGAQVVMLARETERLAAAARAVGSSATPVAADVSDPDSVRAAFAEVEGRFGRLDVLVNNAGVTAVAGAADASDDDIQRVIGTDLLGPIYCTRSAIPLLELAGGGDIVNMGSEVIVPPYPPLSFLYCTAKAGLATFSDVVHRELRGNGIRVTHCIVGRTATDFGADIPPDGMARLAGRLKEERYYEQATGVTRMPADEVAAVVLFVATRPKDQVLDVIRIRASR